MRARLTAPDRLDLARLRTLGAEAVREPWLAIGAPLLLAAVGALLVMAGRWLSLPQLETVLLGATLGAAFGISAGTWLARKAANATFGPLGPLFCDPAQRRRWIVRRGLLLTAATALPTFVALPPLGALALIAAFVISTGTMGLRGVGQAGDGGAALSTRWPLGRLATSALIVAAATLAAWRGSQEAIPALTLGGVLAASLGAGLVWLRIEPRLFRLLLATRRSLGGLLLSQARAPLLAGLVGGIVAALLSNAPPVEAGFIVLAALAGLAALVLLRGLTLATRSGTAVDTAFALDAGLIALLTATVGPLAALWAAIRITWLWRTALTRRWEAR